MGTALAVLAWLFSAAPLCAAAWIEVGPTGGSLGHTGLVLLPWIALAGLPRGARRTAGEPSLPWTALFLPPLVLAAHLDLAGGASFERLALGLCGMLCALALLVLAARRAAPAGWIHPVGWLVLVAGPPALVRATILGVGEAPLPLAQRVAGASPLETALRLASGRAVGAVEFATVAAGALVLLVLTEADRRRRKAS